MISNDRYVLRLLRGDTGDHFPARCMAGAVVAVQIVHGWLKKKLYAFIGILVHIFF